MVGFNRRHSGHTAAARRFLASATGPALVHCRINAGDIARGSWVTDPDAGGDRIRGEACHFVDLAQCLVGSRPVVAEAVGLPPTRSEDPCEDVAALLTFEDGSLCNLVYTARGHRSFAKERVEIFRGGRVVLLDNFRATRFYGPGAPRTYRTWRLDRGYRGELTAWVSALRSAGVAPVEFDIYVASTLATFALAEALQTGRRAAVDQPLFSRLTANA
jgi:polar amino acid transport system substrate-binding protein